MVRDGGTNPPEGERSWCWSAFQRSRVSDLTNWRYVDFCVLTHMLTGVLTESHSLCTIDGEILGKRRRGVCRSSNSIGVTFAPMSGSLFRSLREGCGDALFDRPTRHHVCRPGEREHLLKTQSGERGRKRLDDLRLDRRAIAHEPHPCAVIVRLRQRRRVGQAEFTCEALGVERADAKYDERPCVAEDGVL